MRALITGAAGGIGAATAKVLHDHGCEVVATARTPELLEAVPAHARLALDVTSDASVAACMAAAGDVDVLVNNAAISEKGPLEHYPIERFRACLETNTVGVLRMVQAVLPVMRRKQSGVIVNVSSVNGRVALPLEGSYSATKFALEALSESLHYELAHFGIRVVIVEPGYIAPGMKASPAWGMEPPYDELGRQLGGLDAKLLGEGGRPQPEIVGEAIWSAITADAQQLRVPVGRDAEMSLKSRSRLDDASFEQAMRTTLGITW